MESCEYRSKFIVGIKDNGEVSDISFILCPSQGFVKRPMPICALLSETRRSAEAACVLPEFPRDKCPIASFANDEITLQKAKMELIRLGIVKL